MQVLDEGFCFQEGTKPQTCVLKELVPRPSHFSLVYSPWHKSLKATMGHCALAFHVGVMLCLPGVY